MRWRQLDYDHALWLALHLCADPRRVFRNAAYRNATKQTWARDDPAFAIGQAYALAVAALAYSIALPTFQLGNALRLALHAVAVDGLLIAASVATFTWWLTNTYLVDGATQLPWALMASSRSQVAAAAASGALQPERVEWMYAFDVHCNAFFPLYMILYVGQLLLLPLFVEKNFVAALASNALYACALGVYNYITFLGYSELPFVRRAEIFGYPIVVVVLAFIASIPASALTGFSASHWVLPLYFPSLAF